MADRYTAQISDPIQLGDLTLPNRVWCSPLAGVSDLPFRRMTKHYRPGLFYCEMVKMEALLRAEPNTMHLLDYEADMHPIGAQIVGSNPKLAGPCAKIIEELGFDVVDLNCGCPVDKVTKDASGSGLLKEPERIGEILANMVASVSIPVTVKIRTGWDEEQIVAPLITKIAEEAGAKAIAIHGRTRKQAYRGSANRTHIRSCKEVASSILVIGNGDLFSAQDALDMVEETDCDVLLCSRGTMGTPWLIEEILRAARKKSSCQKSTQDIRNALYEHFLHTLSYEPPSRVSIAMRRVGCMYFKKNLHSREFRGKMSRANSIEEVRSLILDFPFELEKVG